MEGQGWNWHEEINGQRTAWKGWNRKDQLYHDRASRVVWILRFLVSHRSSAIRSIWDILSEFHTLQVLVHTGITDNFCRYFCTSSSVRDESIESKGSNLADMGIKNYWVVCGGGGCYKNFTFLPNTLIINSKKTRIIFLSMWTVYGDSVRHECFKIALSHTVLLL